VHGVEVLITGNPGCVIGRRLKNSSFCLKYGAEMAPLGDFYGNFK
jgi:hypothetical protein